MGQQLDYLGQRHSKQPLLTHQALEKTDRRGERRRGLGMSERRDGELLNCVETEVLLSLVESVRGVVKTFCRQLQWWWYNVKRLRL